nr:MAG TPA: hypothetical protein [Caudoviricetes sp.]
MSIYQESRRVVSLTSPWSIITTDSSMYIFSFF